MTRKACAECTLSNSILERGLPGRNLYSLEPAAPVVRRKLTNTWRAIARQVPAVLVANRPKWDGFARPHDKGRFGILGLPVWLRRVQRGVSRVASGAVIPWPERGSAAAI